MAKRSFAVIGLGRFGSAIAAELAAQGHGVVGIDRDPGHVRDMADVVTQALELDATDERALRAAGIEDVDVAVISIGENIESSLLVVMLAKELGIETIVAKATTPLHGRILRKLGVSRVIFPDREMAMRVAHSLAVPNVLDYIELSREFSIVEIPAPASFAGRTLKDLAFRQKYGLTLIAIRRPDPGGAGETTNIGPSGDDEIRAGDVLALLGPNEKLAQIDAILGRMRASGR